jgi:hypothetical protein
MKSRRFRRSGHPLTQAIDASVDSRQALGLPVTTGQVTSDLVGTVPAALMLTEFGRLVGGRVRDRLRARGELVIDETTWERATDVDVTDQQFKVTVAIKQENVNRVTARLKAEKEIEKFLDRQAARLSRPVTMGEFEAQIDKIYAKHGF